MGSASFECGTLGVRAVFLADLAHRISLDTDFVGSTLQMLMAGSLIGANY